MRDIATYESNFAEENSLRSTFLRLHKQVNDAKVKIEKVN